MLIQTIFSPLSISYLMQRHVLFCPRSCDKFKFAGLRQLIWLVMRRTTRLIINIASRQDWLLAATKKLRAEREIFGRSGENILHTYTVLKEIEGEERRAKERGGRDIRERERERRETERESSASWLRPLVHLASRVFACHLCGVSRKGRGDPLHWLTIRVMVA